MAFHDYHARDGGNSFSDQVGNEQPNITPLNLELVPPVLCHSFGIPMHDAYFLPGPNLYSYGYGVPGGMPQRDPHNSGYQGQYMNEHGQISHGGGMGYGVMGPGDPNGYAQQGYPQARMYPYHPAFQRPRQVSYPSHNEMYNPGMFRRPDGGAMEMCMPPNPAQISGYDCMVPRQQGMSDGINRGMKRSADQANSLNSDHGGVASGQAHLEAVALKRTRLVWTPELHQRFEEAVLRAGGIEVAVPKTVLEFMSVDGLTRDNVASHLQKHRMHLKKSKSESKPASRTNSKPYTQADTACTQSARTCETSNTTQERSQPSSPHGTAEEEATTMQTFTNNVAVAAKSHGNGNFVSALDDGMGRAQGESSGDGISGSGSGNSSSRNVTSIVLATPHSHTGSARDSRRVGSDVMTGSHTMLSFGGTTGCSNGASNGTSKDQGGRRTSQTNEAFQNGRSHNNSNGNSHPGHDQTRGSQTRDTNRVDDSNGTSATCGQSACDQAHEN